MAMPRASTCTLVAAVEPKRSWRSRAKPTCGATTHWSTDRAHWVPETGAGGTGREGRQRTRNQVRASPLYRRTVCRASAKNSQRSASKQRIHSAATAITPDFGRTVAFSYGALVTP
jgi:hypothetical protein